MLGIVRFDHLLLTIPPGSTAAARAFYGQLLRLPELPGAHPKGAIWFQAGDVQLHLREQAAPPTAASDRHPAFEVADVAAARAALLALGVPLEDATPIGGRQRFFLRDPFGNRLELLQFK